MMLISENKLSELTDIPVRTLQNQRQKGDGIPYVKIGKTVRYDLDVVHDYLKNNLYISTSQQKNNFSSGIGVEEINSP